MTIDEQLQQITENLNTLTRIHLDDDREYRERFSQIQAQLDTLTRNAQQDAENIRALARIAEIHERRLTELEGGET